MKRVALLLGLLAAFVFSFAQPKDPPKGAKCVVCGMDVNMMPKFTSQLKLKDGKYVYTESPKHAIQYYLKNKDRVAELWVRDFSSGKWIDGRHAYYVPVDEGPMGPDIVAFRSLVEAKKFAKGKKVFKFRDIDAEFLKHLDMGHMH
ncbi:nitrous oxide reductase accessory protein NosL [Hydrogenivirga caldilitoris]|uniref:Nitrous oxide reductase accessory protein NosL n=1 Tax=Hydrogenivirga caldilitoris TaxID=246264 RepID=A0A497XMZ7_9AQUI|nr:nitrous oxide reductase accessory protein NosL [Hydrogenivirga caldilitoris]RLJ70326.1 nitrous oxide reductase accessory protein NosL [Hydrogenivirga caldilitoris]